MTGIYIKKGKESIKIAKKNLFNEYEKNQKEVIGYLYKDDLNTLLPSMSTGIFYMIVKIKLKRFIINIFQLLSNQIHFKTFLNV